jgi:predicted esterase
MATPISRRSVLAAGTGAAVGLTVPGPAARATGPATTGPATTGPATTGPATVPFTLGAETLDGGEQVTSITLRTAGLGPVDPASLTTATFRVHATATSPIPVAPDDVIYSEYDLDRTVTAARLDRLGNVVLDLGYAEGQVGGGTLGYVVSKGRNVRLDLAYTITQTAPLTVRGRPVTVREFVPGRLVNPEVDAFGHHVSASGLKYRLYVPPHRADPRPLIVWLHGAGEGASLPDGYYDNETTLRANRGALGFATPRAQQIFSGAYVVVPQSTSYWLEDGDGFAPRILEVVREVARRHPVDRRRIHVAGCSNGGYLSLKMTTVYPGLFASSVPVCAVVDSLEPGGPTVLPDDDLRAIRTPTWLVASADDDTVSPERNTVHAHDLIPRSLMTLYDTVTWNGHRFLGHWSWIYVARNDPSVRGTHVWQWMARHRA